MVIVVSQSQKLSPFVTEIAGDGGDSQRPLQPLIARQRDHDAICAPGIADLNPDRLAADVLDQDVLVENFFVGLKARRWVYRDTQSAIRGLVIATRQKRIGRPVGEAVSAHDGAR